MKKLIWFLLFAGSMCFCGCFDTTEEITINKDGTGIYTNTTDLSDMLALLKQMGGDSAQKLTDEDTTLPLAGIADSIAGLTSRQKRIIDQGRLRLTLNTKDEKMIIGFKFPFQTIGDVAFLKQALPQVTAASFKKIPTGGQMPSEMNGGLGDSSELKTFDDYFDLVFSDKVLSKTLNKDRYSTASDNENMKSLQQISALGSPVTVNYVFNLPGPATKAEGKSLKISGDKRKITISVTADDFFDDPSKFEYRIEY